MSRIFKSALDTQGGMYASCILMRSPFHIVKERPQCRDARSWRSLKVHKTSQQLDFSNLKNKLVPPWDVFMDGVFKKRALENFEIRVCLCFWDLKESEASWGARSFVTAGEIQAQSDKV